MVDDQQRPKILVVGYLCVPGRGSERGAGWGLVRALQRFADCTVITGPESGAAIRAWMEANPDTSLREVTVREPLWAPALKSSRIGEFLVYLGWQRRAVRKGRSLAESGRFALALHATLSAFWLPSAATEWGLPSVWGPVGGAVTTPWRLWGLLGWRGVLVEVVDWIAVRVMSLLPATRRTWRRATLRVVQNEETLGRLPRSLRDETVVLNHAVFHSIHNTGGAESDPRSDGIVGGRVAWVSPMESRKGPELAVRALGMADPAIEMIMVGDGPEMSRIQGIAQDLGLLGRIHFEGMVRHDRALEIIRGADVALFTGMREEGGLALSEALLLGTPVVVLANGGAGTIARSSTDQDRVTLVEPAGVSDTIAAVATALEHQVTRERGGGRHPRRPLIDQDAAVSELARLVAAAGGG